ncbi:hypothetical protein AYK26_01210 [Euryarchaeota archaeon SM23-78]|nr:MAG: hypothetical protein AYK26_01210 [Euryarchaeota archaeon SM23-78]
MITWGAIFHLVLIIWVPLVIIILGPFFLRKLIKRFFAPRWISVILFFVILALLFLIEIVPFRISINCVFPPCGYVTTAVSAYTVFSYLSSYPEHLKTWATPFTFPVIMLEILAAFLLSKAGAWLVGKIKAKLSERTKPS